MSYIVKGANIPVSCDSCPLMRWNDYGIDGELQYCNILRAICEHEEGQRDVDCPLAEIPPHGRLVDAEELLWEMRKAKDFGELTAKSAMRAVKYAQTIIEAEEVKE